MQLLTKEQELTPIDRELASELLRLALFTCLPGFHRIGEGLNFAKRLGIPHPLSALMKLINR